LAANRLRSDFRLLRHLTRRLLQGDAQGVSSISAPNSVKLYEAWIQENFLGNHVSVLAGLYDLNSELSLAVGRIVPQQLVRHWAGVLSERRGSFHARLTSSNGG